MKDCVSSLHSGLRTPTLWASSWVILNVCEPEEGRFNVLEPNLHRRWHGKGRFFLSLFHISSEIAQPDYTRRDSTALGVIRTLSRIDRIFTNLPMAAARDFHCYSHVFENLANRSISSDHAAVRLVSNKTRNREQHGKRIPSWMSKHPVFCSILKRLHDDHRYSPEPFGALPEFKTILEKAKKQTIRELSLKDT